VCLFVCVCLCLCVRPCVSTPLHGSARNFVGIVYWSQRVAWATLFLRARLRACARRVVHFTHARVCTLLNIFSPKLVETFLGSQKRARHNVCLRTCALACARNARGCTRMRACVRSNIFGGIRSQICENITLHVLHAFYVRTCVCTLCTHYARACTARMCALTHFWTILSKIDGDIPWITETCTA
jgi:hypothetical protein